MAEWVPQNERQHPPFEPGNQVAAVHGAHSERQVAPLAAEIERAARTGPTWPAYLDEPTYAGAVSAWARAEAVVELLWRWLAEQDPLDALSSSTESTTDLQEFTGGSRARTVARQTESVLNQLNKWEATAARQRQRLGLDPLSRARLGRDVTAAQADLAQLLSAERERREGDAPTPAAGAEQEGGR